MLGSNKSETVPITCAILEFKAEPEGGEDFEDAIRHPWHFTNSSSIPMAGTNLGLQGNSKGLLGNAWKQTNCPKGKEFTIDLHNLSSHLYPKEPLPISIWKREVIF